MSDSARYSRLLHPKGQGCPLFRPQPFDDLPPTLRQTGTRIGDVGIVTPNGAFDPIFNILDRAEDNHSGVPQGFEQVRLRHNAITEERLCYPPGSDISSTTIEKRRLGVDVGFENNVFAPAGVGAVVEVSTNSKETAMLLLPDGASRWDLRALRVFRDYALKHAPKWYEFVNGDLGRMIGNGDLYLVTGVTKSTSWSVAALENQSGDGQVSLKLKAAQVAAAGVSYAWEWESASSSVNSGPHRLPGEESWRDNQTVFVRGFKVCLRTKPLRRSPKLLTIVDSKWSDLSSKSTFVPFSDPRPESSSTTDRNFPSSPAGTSGSDSVSDGEESLNYVSNLPHPSDGINEFLLDYNRDAIVAVTHDDELNSILTEADDEVPENHELISRILKKFTVETTSNGVYLQARSTDKYVSGPSGQQAVLDNVQMDGHYQPPLTSSTSNSSLKDSTVNYPDYDCPPDSLEDIPGIWCTVPEYADSLETTDLEHLQTALGEQNMVNVTPTYNCILPLKRTRFHSPISLQMRTPPGGSWSDALTIDSSSSPTDTHPSSPLITNSVRDSPVPAASPAGPNHFRKRTLLIGAEGTDGHGSSKHGTLYDLKRFLNDHIPHSQNHHTSAEPVIETTGTRDFPSEDLPELSASSFTTKNIAPSRLQVVADSTDSSCLGPTVLQTAEEEEAQFVKSPICDYDTNLQKQRVLSWINDTARPLVQALPPIPPDIDRTDHRGFYRYTPNEVKYRKRTSSANLRVLENVFKRDTKLNEALRTELAAQLNMTARGVQVWFQNRRAKEKNKLSKSSGKSTDYDCLSLRLPENRATCHSSPEGLSASSSPRPTRTDQPPYYSAAKDPNHVEVILQTPPAEVPLFLAGSCLADLKHNWCNVPRISRGQRNSEEIRHRVVRRDARIFSPSNTVSSDSTAGRKVDFGGPSWLSARMSSTPLLARQNEINMNLMCRAQPVSNTGSVPPVTEGRRASTAHSRTFTYRSRTVSLRVASRENASALSADVATPADAAQSDMDPALPGKFWVLSEEEQRCESPVAMFECNGWCRDGERDGERNDTDGVKPDVMRADVVSLASCKDSEIRWEDGDRKSMTASLVEILRRDPHQSLKDVPAHISYTLCISAHRLHTKARAYGDRLEQFLTNITENTGIDSGHSTQVENERSEEDGKDECLIPLDGGDMKIIDNVGDIRIHRVT